MKKLLMIVLDGFGLREETHGNAIKAANMQFFNKIWEEYPHSVLDAAGESVGLPEGIFGSSESGHEILSLGTKPKHKLTTAYEEISSKRVMENEELKKIVQHVKDNDSVLHLMGLVSDGGVHSHNAYILKLIPILKEMGVTKIIFHVITDGRDTYQKSSLKYIEELENVLKSEEIGVVGTVCGRYYAMDRDRNYDRTEIYYNMITGGKGLGIRNLSSAIEACYNKGITDEFLLPLLLKPNVKIMEHDALLWLNFRFDRTTQIMNALTDPEFDGFTNKLINNLKVSVLYPQISVKHVGHLFEEEKQELYSLGEYFSDLGLTQARIAESEKYSYVTKIFNVEKTKKFPGQDNILIPSKEVATFDLAPLMSAPEITKEAKKSLEKDYDFILVNYANPDMVGHTGNFEATVEAMKGLDSLLEELITHAEDNFYKVVVVSDHGNADTMLREDGTAVTTHSLSPVPFILMDKSVKLKAKGELISVAPTILKYLDIAIPTDMKETPLLIIDDKE